MKRFIEFIFDKLPGNDNNLSFTQKLWVVIIALTFSGIILVKTINHLIKNF